MTQTNKAGQMGPIVLAVALCVVVGAATVRGQTRPPSVLLDNILAVVQGQVILRSDVRAFLSFGLARLNESSDDGEHVLTAIIERQLILGEVERYLIGQPSPVDVNGALRRAIADAGGPGPFETRLAALGFTREDLEQILRDNLRIDNYLSRRFPSAPRPIEDEVNAYIAALIGELRVAVGSDAVDAVRVEARQRLAEVSRQVLIDDWVTSLVARADIVRMTLPSVGRRDLQDAPR